MAAHNYQERAVAAIGPSPMVDLEAGPVRPAWKETSGRWNKVEMVVVGETS